jgi:hypothetical protein
VPIRPSLVQTSPFPHFPLKLWSSLKNFHQKPPNLFISGFPKATYNYFYYFGPWTAFVQGPPLNSCVMNVITTTFTGRPVKNRRPHSGPAPAALGGAAVLGCGLPRRLAASAQSLPATAEAQSQPLASTSSFAYFFAARPDSPNRNSQVVDN